MSVIVLVGLIYFCVFKADRRPSTWKMAVHAPMVDNVCCGDKFCVFFSKGCLKWDLGFTCVNSQRLFLLNCKGFSVMIQSFRRLDN